MAQRYRRGGGERRAVIPGRVGRYDRRVDDSGDSTLDLGRRLQAVRDEQDREDRARAAAMTVSERLALGVELSMFSARMRAAFRDQSLSGR